MDIRAEARKLSQELSVHLQNGYPENVCDVFTVADVVGENMNEYPKLWNPE